MKIKLNYNLVQHTLSELQKNGTQGIEWMVFWLGKKQKEYIIIEEMFIPQQTSKRIYIKIDENGMDELLKHLKSTRRMVAVQVHIHPKAAYHSEADDKLAIMRHQGALSIVLPNFGLSSTTESFFNDAACFVLDSSGKWVATNIFDHLEIMNQ